MSHQVEPPPINDPFTTDTTTGKIKSTTWLAWLSSLSDAISSGVLDSIQSVQSTVKEESTATAQEVIANIAITTLDAKETSTESMVTFPVYDLNIGSASASTVDTIDSFPVTDLNTTVSTTTTSENATLLYPFTLSVASATTTDVSGLDTLFWNSQGV